MESKHLRLAITKYSDITSDLAREGLQVNQAWMKGETADTLALYDAMVTACKDMAGCMADCLADTPLGSFKSLENAMNKSLSSLSAEEKMARAFVEE